jgi:hypothetical protein
MPMFGKQAPFNPFGSTSEEPSLGANLLNLVGENLLGVNYLGMKRRQDLATQQKAFLTDLMGKLAPQYQSQPMDQVQAPEGAQAPPDVGAVSLPFAQSAPPQAQPGPDAFAYKPPVRTADPLNANSPDLPALALKAMALGVPLTGLMDVLKTQQPQTDYVNGFRYNKKDLNSGPAFAPTLEKGQEPLFDANHNIVGVRNIDGSVQSAAQMAGAVKGAEAQAQAPFQAVQTFGLGGRPKTITALQLAQGAGGEGQSAAETAADTTRATAGATADVNLPQTLSSAQQTIATIEALKNHPALNDRTGWRGVLPAVPGTSGVDFDASLAQLKGKLFLEAYGQLKGGGQITEVEGKKATEAMARLNQSQTKDGFVKALTDLESVIKAGASRAAGQPSRLQPNAPASTPAAAPRTSGFRSRIVAVH